ncbi:MAG: protein-glutamate O-methyltransferase CheR [Deltaproteobacteria bacterium]|nr:protein-glutamate O-methyltransferase CheR [Deltaproteobacteria bacterium]
MNDMTDQELNLFIDLVKEHTGIKMHQGKKMLLVNRLNKRMRTLGMDRYREYYNFVADPLKGKDEVFNFIDAVTTNETYFYRAPKVWDFFQNDFLVNWRKDNPTGKLKIWSAASSSGEEPYTIALCCAEFEKKDKGFSWQEEASDISDQMIKLCNEGRYKGRAIENVPKPQLKEYFEKIDEEWFRVQASLKRKVKFFKHKLQDKPKGSGYDIIFLRNVMIYFEKDTKALILEHMSNALKPNGILVIGESEGLIGVEHDFKFYKPSVYQKKE